MAFPSLNDEACDPATADGSWENCDEGLWKPKEGDWGRENGDV